ncbi:intron-binding protein aquarius [Monoraphidium neglectum]|uniref:Intron-binding protein aquarius n=1 Tax=Monoraphidium neglectum TaxID=145388 RepID=A0A0D2MVS1_9CHLO|nr:intron-binding protein aquarius [Monoraphidium neglectum]KIY98425.1 intron-binding protein aquarius [Monoraphidium neglectum]|eukprot:XP_013897445.1 intron-binding protein aquarius [Monoraphidium neglectum]
MPPKKAGRGSDRPNKKARPTSLEDVVADAKPGAAGPAAAKTGRNTLTVQEIEKDRITRLAAKHWSPAARSRAAEAGRPPPAFDAALVDQLYQSELGGGKPRPPPVKRVMLLEVSQYLENWLWPNFDATAATTSHVMSIVVMVNQKFREGVPAWTCFHTREDAFPGFFRRVLELRAADAPAALSQHERTSYVLFFTNVFASLEDEMVRAQALRLVSLPLWHALSPGRLQLELHGQPALAKRWKALLKKDAKAAKEAAKKGGGGEGEGGGGDICARPD